MIQAARVVLDTSAYSQLRSGHEQVLDWLSAAAAVYVPTIVIGELAAGFRLGSRRAENELALEDFLAEPFVEVIGVDLEVGRRYGDIFTELRRAGTPIPTNDIWIAATTLVRGGHLITFDRDFRHVAGLQHALLRAS